MMADANLIKTLQEGFSAVFAAASESVIIRTITKSRDANDNLVETPTDTTANAVIQLMEEEDEEVSGGEFEVGDAMAFFEAGTAITTDDKIVHNGIVYKIERIIRERTGGTELFVQALLRKES